MGFALDPLVVDISYGLLGEEAPSTLPLILLSIGMFIELLVSPAMREKRAHPLDLHVRHPTFQLKRAGSNLKFQTIDAPTPG